MASMILRASAHPLDADDAMYSYIVGAAAIGSFPLLITGFLLFGGATAANSQARFAATDLADEDHRGRSRLPAGQREVVGAGRREGGREVEPPAARGDEGDRGEGDEREDHEDRLEDVGHDDGDEAADPAVDRHDD